MNPGREGHDAAHHRHGRMWNLLGIAIFLGAIGVSLWQVLGGSRTPPDTLVVRMVHWQLELGYRQALQGTIDRFNALKERQFRAGLSTHRVTVVQMPVTEKVYHQLVYTHLMAGTAPDILEIGKSQEFQGTNKAEFLVPLTAAAQRPNPYHAAIPPTANLTPGLAAALPKLPWKDTFVDGMMGGWDVNLQALYGVPTAFQSWGRLSYNLDLLHEITGSEHLPTTLGELLALGAQVRAYAARTGRDIAPIAGSQYSRDFWALYATPFTTAWQETLDTDLDGTVSPLEGFAGLAGERIAFTDPAHRSFTEVVQAVAKLFPSGFIAMDRDAAMFSFVQGRACAMFTGSWDAGTIYGLAKFRVGIAPLPLPVRGEPWGDPPPPPASEASTQSSGCFGVNKRSPAVAEAIDFLQFLTSFQENERFNREADWVPCVIGAQAGARMQAFQPRLEGAYLDSGWTPAMADAAGGRVSSIYRGALAALVVGESTPEQLAARMAETWRDPNYGERAFWVRAQEDCQSLVRSQERTIGVEAVLPLLAPGQGAGPEAYRALVSGQAAKLNGAAIRNLFAETAGRIGKTLPGSTP
jgi:raffinose/stachyose/melibiose transport system substrate-binding protein